MMKKKRFYIRTGILLVLLAALGYTLYSAVFQNTESVAVGEKAPNFSLEDVDGNRLKLDELKGKGVFLNFWGTWCEPCKREFPYMANQYKVFKDKGVEIVAVNVGESNLAVRNFMKDHGVNFPVVLDKDRQVLNAYDVTPLPTTFLINPDGEIVKVVTGEMTERMIHDYMNMIKPEGSSS
ncbi:thiol-disulfide oxidoreductase ResA [Bacillus haynesii]|nr:thiol-disulfide oxidoreductase ResA [Bacillus haynesii]MCY7769800.1 thiol-disulfide oxidoreductase ResA [Bacillus haynesii]MCY7849361.1 thiol-disulfide oxidoreductase ResA [Bacillus haynesii]MCY7859876.1 thiol-disulfide oxidoreductase ResA [Bacillus haynesii]MCY7915042.1 thiol-disulfide oxidoreductase ResA [Bacillus haynesii]MCY7926120.1 thiol-disulfide oxidoreductase ResA [Bacillus haynesii]